MHQKPGMHPQMEAALHQQLPPLLRDLFQVAQHCRGRLPKLIVRKVIEGDAATSSRLPSRRSDAAAGESVRNGRISCR